MVKVYTKIDTDNKELVVVNHIDFKDHQKRDVRNEKSKE